MQTTLFPSGTPACLVCSGATSLLDVVDFHKSCLDLDGRSRLALSGRPVYYVRCGTCGFAFAPQFQSWTPAQFLAEVYNEDYGTVDPDYAGARPLAHAAMLEENFGAAKAGIRHLDYGGGNGSLSARLAQAGWDSTSFDPLHDDADIGSLGRFNLITVIEVFEHVPRPAELLRDLRALMDDQGCLVIFSTAVSDGQIEDRKRLDWWYAAPRNGHISLYTIRSLAHLGAAYGLKFATSGPGMHFYTNTLPAFASPPAAKDATAPGPVGRQDPITSS